MKILPIYLLLIIFINPVNAQKYISQQGYISFFSETPLEDIKADNFEVSSAIDISTGEIVFKVPITSFAFKKKLMQEHFNENYMESEKFPYAGFEGMITNIQDIDFAVEGRYYVDVKGKLSIHGITREVTEEGQMDISGDRIFARAGFFVKPADYDISIPKLVRKKIAETIMINVDIQYHSVE